MPMLAHDHYMRRALQLAANTPQFPCGAVIAHRESGAIVAEGWNRCELNPTWHGEIDALNALYRPGRTFPGRELVLSTTAEPCLMCLGAILWSGIATVVFGTSIRFLQQRGWPQIDLVVEEILLRSPAWKCNVIGGVLQEECNALFEAGPPSGFLAAEGVS